MQYMGPAAVVPPALAALRRFAACAPGGASPTPTRPPLFTFKRTAACTFSLQWLPSAALSARAASFRACRAFLEPPLERDFGSGSGSTRLPLAAGVLPLLDAWRAGLATAFPGSVGITTTPDGEAALAALHARILDNEGDMAQARGFYLPSLSSTSQRLEKRAEKVLTAWAAQAVTTAQLAISTHPPVNANLAGEAAHDAAASLSRAAATAGHMAAGPHERLLTRVRESHVWERGDELSVTSGALARHRAALALLARYGARCSLAIALIIDVIEYYRAWGNRRDLVRGAWTVPSEGSLVESLSV